jgi:hypothetical protein
LQLLVFNVTFNNISDRFCQICCDRTPEYVYVVLFFTMYGPPYPWSYGICKYLQYMLFYSLPCTGLRIHDRMEYVTISSICCFILYHVRASETEAMWFWRCSPYLQQLLYTYISKLSRISSTGSNKRNSCWFVDRCMVNTF